MKKFEVMASGKQYIAVEVKPTHKYFEIRYDGILMSSKEPMKANTLVKTYGLPSGNYTIIGKVLNLTDEQMAGITGVSANKAMLAMEFLIERERLDNNHLILERK